MKATIRAALALALCSTFALAQHPGVKITDGLRLFDLDDYPIGTASPTPTGGEVHVHWSDDYVTESFLWFPLLKSYWETGPDASWIEFIPAPSNADYDYNWNYYDSENNVIRSGIADKIIAPLCAIPIPDPFDLILRDHGGNYVGTAFASVADPPPIHCYVDWNTGTPVGLHYHQFGTGGNWESTTERLRITSNNKWELWDLTQDPPVLLSDGTWKYRRDD